MNLESEIQKQGITLLKQLGYWVERVNCGKVKTRGGWFYGFSEGTADLIVFLKNGKVAWVEFKKPDGKQRPGQKEFKAKAVNHGHSYIVVWSENGLKDMVDFVKRAEIEL